MVNSGLCRDGHSLVAEATIDLEHLLESTHHQALEVQLGRDAQVQVLMQHVVVRHERTRRRPSCDRVHHGRLDFQKASLLQLLPQAVE